jgi:hypothetical protein
MSIPARRFIVAVTLFAPLLFLQGLRPVPSAAQADSGTFYGEDRVETILGTPVNVDVDGRLEKQVRAGASCVERFGNLAAASPSVEDQADSHQVGVRCFPDRLRVSRLYLSFDTSELPDGATVNAAVLYLTKAAIADNEFTARFEIRGSAWSDPTRLQADDWDRGTVVWGTFDAPANDPEGTSYAVSLNPQSINKTGRTQFELRLYDEAGESGLYGNFREQILQTSRQRIFYSGDAAAENLQPRLEVSLTTGSPPPPPPSEFRLWPGWNEIIWPAGQPEEAAVSVLTSIDDQCAAGTALAASQRRNGLWESFRYHWGGLNFDFLPGNVYYLLVSQDCSWEPIQQ